MVQRIGRMLKNLGPVRKPKGVKGFVKSFMRTMLERLRRGELLSDGRSAAQERALIHGKLKGES